MGYAFISYSTKNQTSADAIRNIFAKNGIATWMAPNNIPVGSSYPEVITQALKDCSCLVLLLSNDAQNSIWVSKEVERAINYKKPIFPLQLEDVILNNEFELYISTNQIIAINKVSEQSDAIQKLLAAICACLGQPCPTSAEAIPAILEKEVAPITPLLSVGDVIDGKYQVTKHLAQTFNGGLFITNHIASNQNYLVKAIYKKSAAFDAAATTSELATLRSLSHPNLPALIDIVDNEKMILVVFQYCDGDYLRDMIAQGTSFTEDQLIDWAMQLCDTLATLHRSIPANSFIHINPGNIMLNSRGRIILLDFLYRHKKDNEILNAKNSLDSLFYLAPEILDTASEVTHQTDIYSLGATLYSLATCNDPTLPPHAVYPLRQRNPQLSAGLEYIITKCMETSPEKRYDSADSLLYDLKNSDKLTKKLSHQSIIQKLFKSKK